MKKDFDVMVHLEAEWLSQQNILIFNFFLFHYFLVPLADTISAELSSKSSIGGFTFGQKFWNFRFNSQHSICKLRKLIIYFQNKIRITPIVKLWKHCYARSKPKSGQAMHRGERFLSLAQIGKLNHELKWILLKQHAHRASNGRNTHA